ncbi:MAG: 30S ribosomal protein S12 methylthiotransferase RimO [Magnetococcales bacterium]|nr:30S ribosomal protein S12 methylthiotransferase RimO [Magnetococcales bacterium]
MSDTNKRGLVGVISLGCPKNLVDTERMLGRFIDGGYSLTTDPEKADLLVVNTCGFKADAEEESREAIAEMAGIKAKHPGVRLVVTGCLSQRYGEQLLEDIPQIDLLTGTSEYEKLIPILEANAPPPPVAEPNPGVGEEGPRILTTQPHTAYVKIAEGCNNPCAFCIIPKLRGAFVSREPEDIDSEIEALVEQGVVEVNLISQDTTLYGRDLDRRLSLADLLHGLKVIEGLDWIRLLYLYPTMVTDQLLDVISEDNNILPYFDIPLQHSHSAVLKRMKRAEREQDVYKLIKRIRNKIPDATIRTTFIVGFPGESADEFLHLYDFIKDTRFDHVGVFTYSDEQGTTAYDLPDKIPDHIAQERRDKLMALQQTISQEKLAAFVGKTIPVLVEGVSEENEWLLEGRTMGQAPDVDGVVYINDGSPDIGSIVDVEITESHEYDLVGHLKTPREIH